MQKTIETIKRILRVVCSFIHFFLGHLSHKDNPEDTPSQQN